MAYNTPGEEPKVAIQEGLITDLTDQATLAPLEQY
jgi:hypothetical protein